MADPNRVFRLAKRPEGTPDSSAFELTGEAVPTAPRKLPGLVESRARVESFLVRDFRARYRQATRRLAGWLRSGDLASRETVTECLEDAPAAFLGVVEGDDVGKQLVQVRDRDA
jgi:NADPH-dependent curcumin reductase CurA